MMPSIKEALVIFNPWWKGPYSSPFKNRALYGQIQKFMPLRQLIALTGLRRVGKTTLMQKIIQDALAHTEPRRILYFSFDEFKQASLHELLGQYATVTGLDLNDGKYLVLLDEVQKLSDWENQVKTIYDTKPHFKIIVSGSESLFIRKKSRETLAGRMFEFKVEPLTFPEYLSFSGLTLEPAGLYRTERRQQLAQYLKTQGFPELHQTTDPEIISKYIRESIVEKIIYRDLPTLIPIQNTQVLDHLLQIIMENPGQLLEINQLASELSISRQTASAYLNYLEQSFLIRKLYNYSTNARKTARKLRKYYPEIVAPHLPFKDDDATQSKLLEWLAVRETRSEYFWRDAYQHEVDIVQPGLTNEPPQAIEVKYGKIDTRNLERFMKKFNSNDALIVTHDTEKTLPTKDGRTIRAVPAYDLLLERTGP